jgi:hypothetical protein
MRQGCLLSLLLFNIVFEFIARAIRKEENVKGKYVEKEVVKSSLFADDMVLYLKDQENSTKILQYVINSFSKLQDIKSIYKNQ